MLRRLSCLSPLVGGKGRVLCALALLLAGCDGTDPVVAPSTPASRPRTIVLVSLDTLRPERLGLYGNTPDVSPVLDAFAREAVVFDTALAPSPWTLPSHLTMFTGLDPVAHGVINESKSLSENAETLGTRLSEAGYATGGFTDGGFMSGRYGFSRGFDVFDDKRSEDGPNGFPRLMPRAIEWLTDQGEQDVFLFLHTFDAHTPYDEVAPEILDRFRARPVVADERDAGLHWLGFLYTQAKAGITNYPRMGNLLNDYDAGVHEADLHLGRLFEALRAIGRWDDALIIVTSDHGESFFDHGLHVGHGLLLTDAELRVPLLIRLPGGAGAGKRFDELVGLVDIPRTIFEVAGLSPGDDLQGESLIGLVNGYQRSVDYVLGMSQNMRSFTLVQADFKYISPVGVKPMRIAEKHLGPSTPPGYFPVDDEMPFEIDDHTLSYDAGRDPLGLLDVIPSSEQLFDRRTDRDELNNLVGTEVVKLAEIRSAFRQRQARSASLNRKYATGEVQNDPASIQVLKMLGYMESGREEDLEGTSRLSREWTLNPHESPDSRDLARTDSKVHELRLQLADGARASSVTADKLLAACIEYDHWGKQNPSHAARVYWRVQEVMQLADDAGITFESPKSPEWLVALQQEDS
jgi:arylsulfatase A-like enzyme